MTDAAVFLSFDPGKKRIGVAVGQRITGTASALLTLKAQDGQPEWTEVTSLIQQWSPNALIVGISYHKDGTPHEITKLSKSFGKSLQNRYNIEVHWMDEKLSSHEAEEVIKQSGKKESLDAVAAQLILQSWLNSNVQ